jgi:chromosome segregation and condensation protein ScpB
MLRSRAACAPVIRATADVGGQALDLTGFDPAVLAAIAFHRPVGRDGLKEIFGKEISRDLIGTGPREPRRSAPCTFVTTDAFLAAFGLRSLRDLPDPGQMADAGLPGQA